MGTKKVVVNIKTGGIESLTLGVFVHYLKFMRLEDEVFIYYQDLETENKWKHHPYKKVDINNIKTDTNRHIKEFEIFNKDLGESFYLPEIEYCICRFNYFHEDCSQILEHPNEVDSNDRIIWYKLRFPYWHLRDNITFVNFIESLLEHGFNTSLRIVEIPDDVEYRIRQKYTDEDEGYEYGPEYIEEYIEPRIWEYK